MAGRRKPTSTSNFGVSKRESHDASDFYARFTPPEISNASAIGTQDRLDEIFVGDARAMTRIADDSVALVVTSPPYFAGKEYEEALGEGGVPGTYFEYLELLEGVFAECKRTLQPGGRIAVNVANLGRRPYRSLSSDVTTILQDLGLLLRGEVIWQKARGASGNCAWGSFILPTNPVLRDLTERIVIASKGRFDRSPEAQPSDGPASGRTILKDDFFEATTDIWEIPPESATRVGHPAPFPVDLPRQLIDLYTFRDEVVLDPFMGSGTTAVAAVRTGRHYLGYELDPEYKERADERVATERERVAAVASEEPRNDFEVVLDDPVSGNDRDFTARAVREGKAARDLASELLEWAGFEIVHERRKVGHGIEVSFEVRDRTGSTIYVDVAGAFTRSRPGLLRADALWKAIAKAAVLHEAQDTPLMLLTTHAPERGAAAQALAAVVGEGKPVAALFEMTSASDRQRLASVARAVTGADG